MIQLTGSSVSLRGSSLGSDCGFQPALLILLVTHYRRRRDDHGDWHAAAQRNLFNRMIGQLYHCLQNHTLFDESTAFPTELPVAA